MDLEVRGENMKCVYVLVKGEGRAQEVDLRQYVKYLCRCRDSVGRESQIPGICRIVYTFYKITGKIPQDLRYAIFPR